MYKTHSQSQSQVILRYAGRLADILGKYKDIEAASLYPIGRSPTWTLVFFSRSPEPCFDFAYHCLQLYETAENRDLFPKQVRLKEFSNLDPESAFVPWLKGLERDLKSRTSPIDDVLWFPTDWRRPSILRELEDAYPCDRVLSIRSMQNASAIVVL